MEYTVRVHLRGIRCTDRPSVLQACPDTAEQKAIGEQESENLDREALSYMHRNKNPYELRLTVFSTNTT